LYTDLVERVNRPAHPLGDFMLIRDGFFLFFLGVVVVVRGICGPWLLFMLKGRPSGAKPRLVHVPRMVQAHRPPEHGAIPAGADRQGCVHTTAGVVALASPNARSCSRISSLFCGPYAPQHARAVSLSCRHGNARSPIRQVLSLSFNSYGRVYKMTGGYVVDRTSGDSGGLGGMFGIFNALGRKLPFREGQPWHRSPEWEAFALRVPQLLKDYEKLRR